MAYRDTRNSGIHGFAYGAADELFYSPRWSARLLISTLRSSADRAAAWGRMEEFIALHAGKVIGGYIGYEMSVKTNIEAKVSALPHVDLRVLENCRSVSVDAFRHILGFSQKDAVVSQNANDQTDTGEGTFKNAVEDCTRWTREGSGRRVTIARRVPLANSLPPVGNLLRSLDADHACRRRHFFISSASGELSGSSPEVLAQGNVHRFVVNKMSGTGKARDLNLSNRIRSEHSDSIAALTNLLSSYGAVEADGPTRAEFDTLWHLQTALTVSRGDAPRKVTDVLRVALPRAGFPQEEAEALVATHEQFGRGPYYGLVGIIRPDGTFDFCMCIRTVFRSNDETWVCVGAAITPRSSADLEWQETRLKLADTLWPATKGAADSSRSVMARGPSLTV